MSAVNTRFVSALALLGPDAARAVAVESWLLRSGLTPDCEAMELTRELAEGRPLLNYAAALCFRNGIHDVEDLPADTIYKRAVQFGLTATIEAAAKHAVLLGYDIGTQSHSYWTGSTGVKDYRAQELGYVSASQLRRVPELGAFELGDLSGDSEQGTLETFGRVIQVGRGALLGDDIEPFLRASNSFGQSARIAEADEVYGRLLSNPTLADGVATFHTDHGNLLSANSPDTTGLPLAMAALRNQLDEESRQINLTPAFLITPVAKEGVARQAVTSIFGAGSPDAPRVLPEPRITDGWYLCCAKSERPALHLLTLSGSRGPSVSVGGIRGFDGEAVKCVHDFGAVVLSWRGIVRTPLT